MILSPLFTWRGAFSSKDSGLTPTQRHVGLVLSLHMNERGGSCFPAIKTLVDETGLCERSVQQALRGMVEAGWLQIQTGGGRRHSNRYVAIIPERVQQMHRLAWEDPQKGAADAPKDVKLTSSVEAKASTSDAPPSKIAPKRRPDELWEALVQAMGRQPETAVERKRWNAALRELRSAAALPADLLRRAEAYRKEWPGIDLTPFGLAANWSRFGPQADPKARAAALFRTQQEERRRNGIVS